jgi:hypothetical protein
MAKSAHQYSGEPSLPVQLLSKAEPPALFLVQAPSPTFASAMLAMLAVLSASAVDPRASVLPPPAAQPAPRATKPLSAAMARKEREEKVERFVVRMGVLRAGGVPAGSRSAFRA